MANVVEEFERMDFEVIFELIESRSVTCYEYYIDGCFEVNYQEVKGEHYKEKFCSS